MQIAPLAASAAAIGGRPAPATAAAGGAARPAAAANPAVREAGAASLPGRAGLRPVDPGLNGKVAGAQRTLDFLEQADRRLQGLKLAFGGTLADGADEAATAALRTQVERFAAFWRQRGSATGGALDGRLNYGEPGAATQRFRIRGLDFGSLGSGERETLSLSLGARGTATLVVEPGLGERAVLARLDQALAPLGLRAQRDAAGQLAFAVAEGDWPAVRDALAIKGEGQRFPTGQFHRMRAEAEADAIQPQHWQVEDVAARRQTLREVSGALDLVRRARAGVGQSAAALAAELETTVPAAGAGVAAFAARFAAAGSQPGFDAFAAVAPALAGVSRQRVEALLRLD